MKPEMFLIALASALVFKPASVPAQPIDSHRIGAIAITPDRQPLLSLAGKPAAAFKDYYDLFRVQCSASLADWSCLVTVVQTNASTNALTFQDPTAAQCNLRFYRTPADPVVTPFLPPTGPHPVGVFSRMLTDSSRKNRFGVGTNSSFMATCWYPAQAQRTGEEVFAPYSDRQLAERRAYWGAYTNRIPSLVSSAVANSPIATNSGLFPVVIYSHGLGDQQGRSARTENTEKVQELVSHGYVVVAVDHTDAYATVLPPDLLIVGRNAWSYNFVSDRLKDVTFLLDRLAEWNTDDPILHGRLNLEQIGIMGWSWGGGTTAEACRREDRLKAAVLLDGYFDSTVAVLKNGLAKPFLAMMNPGGSADNATLFNKASKDAYQLTIKDATHEMFTDNAWIISPSAATRRRAVAMDLCLVSFFNKHLKGLEDHLIDAPNLALPDVISFRKK